jgi:hypothetical protein
MILRSLIAACVAALLLSPVTAQAAYSITYSDVFGPPGQLVLGGSLVDGKPDGPVYTTNSTPAPGAAPADNIAILQGANYVFQDPHGHLLISADLAPLPGTDAVQVSNFNLLLTDSLGQTVMSVTAPQSWKAVASFLCCQPQNPDTFFNLTADWGAWIAPASGASDLDSGFAAAVHNSAELNLQAYELTGPGTPMIFDRVSLSLTAWLPEPGAWALMFVGFAWIGAGLRRRRGECRPGKALSV